MFVIDDLYSNREVRVYEDDAPTLRSDRPGLKVAQPIGIIDPQGRTKKEVVPSDISPTLRAQSHGNQPEVCIPVLTPDRAEKRQNGRRFKEDGDEAFTLTAQDRHGVALGVLRNVRSEYGKEIRKDYEAGNLEISRHEFIEKEVREDGVSNTLDSVTKDNLVAVKVAEATKKGYAEAHPGDSINLSVPGSKTRRGRVGGGVAQTLDTSCNQGVMEIIPSSAKEHPGQYVELDDGCIVYAVWYEKYQCYIAIRKLTPRECFRLQGWTDDYFDKAEFVNSDSQLYRQAGNGVSVPVVYDIARRMDTFEGRRTND